jgi:Protein of unknown function (DUF2924)
MAAKKKTSTKKRASKRTSTKAKAKKRSTAKKRAASKPRTQTALKPGATIEKTFKGQKITVQVTATGYAWKGMEYRSLTALALKVTGYKAVSGPRFFGLVEAKAPEGGAK